jgi:hypothetical protein
MSLQAALGLASEDSDAAFVDVTSLARSVAAELTGVVPMLVSESFSLFDSMNASELMDPKMDQCYDLKTFCGENEPIRSISYIVTHAKFLPTTDQDRLSTYVRLFQALFIYETAFLDGASITETVLNCTFMWPGSWEPLQQQIDSAEHGSKNLAERAVLLYCKSLTLGLQHVFTAVMAADVYEGIK